MHKMGGLRPGGNTGVAGVGGGGRAMLAIAVAHGLAKTPIKTVPSAFGISARSYQIDSKLQIALRLAMCKGQELRTLT